PRKAEFRGPLAAGPFKSGLLEGVDIVCISPGLSLEEPLVRDAVRRQIPVLGDIELFAWHVRGATRSKVLAVTGTNGKTTVTALTAWLLANAGVDCAQAGNIGPPALKALAERAAPPDVWVLELSSYQLETTWSLEPDAAAMLNLSEDHLDRYAGLEQYGAAKARIFLGDGIQVLNRDDPRSLAMAREGAARMSFGLDAPARVMDFGVRDGHLVQGEMPILPVDELPILGMHNVSNALAACALARAMGVALDKLGPGLRTFAGLPHRVQRVATRRGVEWYDDSKGTNVGATVAALTGLRKRVVLIAGGDGKGQDFSPLALPVSQFAKKVLLIGRDAPLIDRALAPSGVPVGHCASLEDAVAQAAAEAGPGDAVLLSPACASFDMFRDYRHRGEAFAAAVKGLGA
ncbi:MAG TPA: UDP-N-acetylmuramoyl-L-alanine--D-glutamate ligase, partial [Burkholderiales bacterium]|nr:UDP-N-acetylmuramoyl-L-alanine--D-glutamate ligase [Burkholderiales bacterium]